MKDENLKLKISEKLKMYKDMKDKKITERRSVNDDIGAFRSSVECEMIEHIIIALKSDNLI